MNAGEKRPTTAELLERVIGEEEDHTPPRVTTARGLLLERLKREEAVITAARQLKVALDDPFAGSWARLVVDLQESLEVLDADPSDPNGPHGHELRDCIRCPGLRWCQLCYTRCPGCDSCIVKAG